MNRVVMSQPTNNECYTCPQREGPSHCLPTIARYAFGIGGDRERERGQRKVCLESFHKAGASSEKEPISDTHANLLLLFFLCMLVFLLHKL